MTTSTASTGSTGSARRLNANVLNAEDGSLTCAHCAHALEGGPTDYVARLPRYESPVSAAGPQVYAESRVFVDTDVVFRQYICPGCSTAFLTEVVPVGKDHVPG
ncbi:MAG: hypothetical protein M3492_07150 [Actinomycetota bacterium]|nr:hypothetical protein [Actinomycetota bacterium]